MRRGAKYVGIPLAVAAILIVTLVLVARHPLPAGGVGGAEADALAHKIQRAVNVDAWNQLGAVRWDAKGGRHHLWDKTRSLARVKWKHYEALVDIGKKSGKAWLDGREVTGDARDVIVEKAWGIWANDSFWLNPLPKLFDEGVTRAVVQHEGKPALLVSYASGGVTPGDSYLWILDDNGRPRAWRMWVHVLPVAGVEATWESWTTLGGGAQVATEHRILGLKAVTATDLTAGPDAASLEAGLDPFARLR